MTVDSSVTLSDLRASYRAACTTSNEIIERIGDAAARLRGKKDATDLRAVMLAVISETARHAGHADIIREQIDGTTGR